MYRYEGSDLLSILDELHPDTLANSRVGLLGFYADLLKDNAFRVRRSSCRGGLVDVSKGTLLVCFIGLLEG